jgi:hypothetical protein
MASCTVVKPTVDGGNAEMLTVRNLTFMDLQAISSVIGLNTEHVMR